jgi:hypothetical protein
MSKLIKARIYFETDIVVENHYEDKDIVKVARDAFRVHRSDIISQAMEKDDCLKVEAKLIKSLNDLPNTWTGNCLPWLPSICFGSAIQERHIKDFFSK